MRDLSNQETIPELDGLYKLASDMDVRVCDFPLPECGAVSVMDSGGRCTIGLDCSKRHSLAEQKTMLAHELGHCSTGAFYNEYSPFSLRSRCERRAEEWAIRKCVPYGRLIAAYRAGFYGNGELAELFGVSESFMHRAVEYYSETKGVINESD